MSGRFGLMAAEGDHGHMKEAFSAGALGGVVNPFEVFEPEARMPSVAVRNAELKCLAHRLDQPFTNMQRIVMYQC